MSDRLITIRHNGQVVDRVQHPPLPVRYKLAATAIRFWHWLDLGYLLPWFIAADIAITTAVITIIEVWR